MKLKALLGVLWAFRKGFVDGRTQSLRWRACHLNGLGRQCPALAIGADGHERCGEAKGPQWIGSRLTIQFQLAGATCPRGKWPERDPIAIGELRTGQ